jgi:hypothetical protein
MDVACVVDKDDPSLGKRRLRLYTQGYFEPRLIDFVLL